MRTKITFWSGVFDATGSNFMLETGKATILIDCGLIQGKGASHQVNCEAFPYDPAAVDALLLTHAHADHIGRIPKLVRDGFRGPIYTTEATRDLTAYMLKDALAVMRIEAKRDGVEPCFDDHDIEQAMSQFKPVSYGDTISLPDGMTATFTNAGHILGSSFITLRRGGKTLVATGDIGNVPQPLLAAPDIPHGYDYLIMESVYGDREHKDVATRRKKLLSAIEDTRARGGVLIMPAFSLERTQAILYDINNAVEQGEIEPIPIYLDSPLAIGVTEVYKKHPEYMRDDVREQIAHGDQIFSFPGLHISRSTEDSKVVNHEPAPKIIIAGSGMSHGGRIGYHEERYLPDKKNMLLILGYQAVGTMGRALLDGAKEVRVMGRTVPVRAEIRSIDGYSAHADRDQLVDFVANGGNSIKEVFVAMGEERASLFLVQRLRDFLGVRATAPGPGESFEIDL